MAQKDPRPNDYIQVSVTLFDNPKLADIADEHGPQIYSLWLYILVSTKRARHLGRVTLNPGRVARMVGLGATLTTALIDSLVECRSLIVIDLEDHLYEVRNWSRWQSLSKAERERTYRARNKASEVLNSLGVVPTANAGTTQEKRREDDTREENTYVGEEPSGNAIAQLTKPSLSRSEDPVWKYWVKVAAPIQLDDPSRAKPTDDRWRRLTARRADGYSDQELCICIDGFVADPHHRGENTQGTPYLDWPTIFKTASKVDEGIRRAKKGRIAAVAVGSEQGRPSRVRPQ